MNDDKRKKILYVSFDYPPRHGGQSTLNFNIVLKLREAYEVDVVAGVKNDNSGVKFRLIDRSRSLLFSGIMLAIKAGRRYDLVIAGDSNASGFTAGIYGFLCRKKVVNLCHGVDFQLWNKEKKNGIRRFLDRRLFLRNVLTVANSFRTKERIEKKGITRKVVVVNPGVDVERNAGFAGKDNYLHGIYKKTCPVFLTVSRLEIRKGIDHVLAAIAEINSDFLYFIMGEGREREKLESLAIELGLQRKVFFLGERSDKDKWCYYNFCDFFVLTPYEYTGKGWLDYEGFGMVYLEANSFGKPVIATRSGGVEDAVKDGYSGILVEQGNIEEIRKAVFRFMQDEDLRNGFSANAIEWAQNFSWSRVGKRYKELIKDVLGNGR